jgi:chlorite dismutase
MVGLRSDADLLLVRFATAVQALETSASLLLRAGMGRSMRVAHSWIGLLRPSQYTKRPTAQEQGLQAGDRAAYLVVYPFTKTHEWYQLSRETRQGMMNEHIRIGHDFPQVRQLLAHSTGLDDQEFIVAYETDDLAAFQDLVVALRETEARRFTLRDSPTLTAVSRSLDDALALLG